MVFTTFNDLKDLELILTQKISKAKNLIKTRVFNNTLFCVYTIVATIFSLIYWSFCTN